MRPDTVAIIALVVGIVGLVVSVVSLTWQILQHFLSCTPWTGPANTLDRPRSYRDDLRKQVSETVLR